MIDEFYQDWYSMFPASHFRFDYESQTIRIPVWAGKINFIFGTQNTSYNFPDDGIYEVHFSSDWNTVTNATKVSSLSESLSYLNSHAHNPPPPQDTISPTIIVSSPQNKTYSATDIFLKFIVNELVSRTSYSIDGKANVTIAGNSVILPVLSHGTHSIVVYASDLAGNTGSSRIIHFTVDTHPPKISLLSPQNQIYSTTDIPLTFTVNERVPWTAYSVDEQTNVTISGNQTLKLADGSHSITVYARDLAGNIGSSAAVYFTIDTTPPGISLLSPENKTYDTTEIQLSFAVNETTSWMGYSLDGQAKVTLTENTTLTKLSTDSHNLIIYARDMVGNTEASEAVTFTIAPPPEPFPPAMTATVIAMIVATGAAFLIYFKIAHKAAKKLGNNVKSDLP